MDATSATSGHATEITLPSAKQLIVNTLRRAWRTPRTHRAKACVWKAKAQRQRTWADKEADRERLQAVKKLERSLKEEARAQRAAEAERRAQMRAEREANALRTGTKVQIVRDSNKIKRMSKKQQKLLRKMAL
jgi:hypothetical protein